MQMQWPNPQQPVHPARDNLLLSASQPSMLSHLHSHCPDALVQGFEEAPIHFPPTYKFDPNTEHYDTSSKLRIPSWTDRILWKVNPAAGMHRAVEVLHYGSVPEIKVSDHRWAGGAYVVGESCACMYLHIMLGPCMWALVHWPHVHITLDHCPCSH